MLNRTVLLLLLLTVLTTDSALGQDDDSGQTLWIGPIVEGRASLDNGSVPVYAGSPDCGEFTAGRSFTASIGDAVAFPTLFSNSFGLQGTLAFSFLSGRLTTTPVDPIRQLDEETGTLIDIDQEYRLSSTSASAVLDILGTLALTRRIGLSFGAAASMRLSSDVTQTEHILAPSGIRLSNGNTKAEMTGGTNPTASSFGLGPTVAATYSLPLGKRSRLVTGIVIRTDLMSIIDGYEWKRFGLGLSTAVLFNLTPTRKKPVRTKPRQTPPADTAAAEPPALTASLEMLGIDDAGNEVPTASIGVYETFYQRHVPMIAAVFFDSGRTVLPGRYVRIDRGSAENFSPDGLSGTDLVGIQQQILNVVGQRLRERPGATLTLAGSSSGDEDRKLQAKRVETIRSYLTEVWGIDRSRIRIDGKESMERSNEETEDGRDDNRRVELASDDPSILGPVVTTRIVREFNPPLIRMKSDFDAQAGVRQWSIVVSQGGTEVARYGSGTDDGAESEMNWRILHDRVDKELSPLNAVLKVEDSTGATVTARASLPLTMVSKPRIVDRRVEQRGDRQRLVWTLVGFGFSSATVESRNQEIVRQIAEGVRSGAKISVTGYTDRIGDRTHNRELATERARNVGALLKERLGTMGIDGTEIDATGGGVETERFDNDLPEGRALSRGVEVVVEQKSQ